MGRFMLSHPCASARKLFWEPDRVQPDSMAVVGEVGLIYVRSLETPLPISE